MQLSQIHFYQKIARKKVARVNAALVGESYRITVSHTESLLVGSGMSTELVPLGKRKATLMFAMSQEDSYLCCKYQLTE